MFEKGDVVASRFRVVEPLGRGGMGVVFRATQQPLARDVALKILRPESAGEAEMLARFEEEAKAIAALRHPAIVTLHDFGPLTDEGLFLAMELVEGESLRRGLEAGGSFGSERSFEIVESVVEGLAEAHRRDVMHRDLKPGNVMLCDDDVSTAAKIVDFGLARRIAAEDSDLQTKTGQLLGTPGFIAPECAVDGEYRDPRSDLYAVGVIWFQMLTGRAPFEGETPLSLVVKHAREAPPRPSEVAPTEVTISEEVEALILELLAKDPADRPGDGVELLDRLARLDGPPNESTGTSEAGAFERTLTKRPRGDADDLLERSDGPVVAVLPFDNRSGDSEQEFFSDGLSEDLITELSRFRSLSVVARQSSFAFKDRDVRPQRIAAELGANYVLEGSVRKAGDQVRVTAQLVDAEQERQVWGENFDRRLEDIFALQDEVTRSIAAVVPKHLQMSDLQKARGRTSDNLPAYESFLRGRESHHRKTPEANEQAIAFLERAVELDPEFAHAWSWLGCAHGQAIMRGFTDNAIEAMQEARRAVERARELDDRDSECHRILCELRMIEQRWESAKFHHDRALELNPNSPRIIALRGLLHAALGNPEEGIEWIEEVQRLNPLHPQGYQGHLGFLFFAAQRYEEAAEALQQIGDPTLHWFPILAGARARLGREEATRRAAEKVLEADPDFSIRRHIRLFPYRFTADRKHHTEALELAGL